MNESATATSADDQRAVVAAARVVVARRRLLRSMARWGLLRTALDALSVTFPLIVGSACFAVIVKFGGPREITEDPVLISLVLLALFAGIVSMIGVMVSGMTVIMTGLVAMIALPWWLWVGFRELRRLWWRAQLEALLERDGQVTGLWARTADQRALLKELAAEPGLRRDPTGGVQGESDNAGPCASCGGTRRRVGDGVVRCDRCRREGFGALSPSPVLEKAQERIRAVPGGMPPPQTRRELWVQFRDLRGGAWETARRQALKVLGWYLGCAVLGELWHVAKPLGMVGLMGICILALPVLYVLGVAASAYYKLRFVAFAPGAAAWETAIAAEVAAVTAARGRVSRLEVAKALGVSPNMLDGLLAQLESAGTPLMVDREHDELVSLSAAGLDDTTCVACGGALSPTTRGRVACLHCGVAIDFSRGGPRVSAAPKEQRAARKRR